MKRKPASREEKKDFGKILGAVAVLLVVIIVAGLNFWRWPPWGKIQAVATAVMDRPTLEERVKKLEEQAAKEKAIWLAAGLDLGRVVIREGKVFIVPGFPSREKKKK